MLLRASSSASELILEILNLIVAEAKAVKTFHKINASKDEYLNETREVTNEVFNDTRT